MQDGTLLAAVDLGSNSFRLEIGRLDHGHILRVEYLKETVRQGGGLDEDRNLIPAAMQRGWDCLARFAERLSGFERGHVRAVATQTLREARNREDFIRRGSEILGFPIDVVSGPEEARLIYQGVARLLPQSDERRLVVDIGGRSTELILGQQFTPSAVASYRVGSVAWSARYFADGAFTREAFQAAEIAAQAVLDEAAQVIGGGVSIVRAIFGLLRIDQMTVAQGALRQGALYDLLDREQPGTDLRTATVRALMQRFAVDEAHAECVAQLACRLFVQAAPAGSERAARKLEWAARLHEIGCRISHSDYHRHGAYILDHTDAAGFALPELHRLSLLVLGHRGKVRKLEADLGDAVFALQLMCLRTAIALCHARRAPDVEGLALRLDGNRCTVRSRQGWAAAYPQSAHLLREEAQAWQKTPWEFVAELA
jgi:exopolyphosphatase/guanosine-5'-triphosphate,3'-diphosphate pyrophosphatase